MREILFRGKAIDDNWYYGVPLVFTEDFVCMTAPHTYNKSVVPSTVGQYTGLTDKNGTKVFEGDIVKHYNKIYIGDPNYYTVSLIEWNDEKYRYQQRTKDGGCYFVSSDCVFEVIGNIHDNPELIEVQDNG